MGTIAIKIAPSNVENPDTDLNSVLADQLNQISAGRIKDDGFDYIEGDKIGGRGRGGQGKGDTIQNF